MNIFNMLKQAHTLKQGMGKVSEELAGVEAEGVSGRGLVTVVMDGQMRVKRVTIAPELLSRGDPDALGEMVAEAVNRAREKAQGLAAEAMRKIAGDLPLPF